MGKQSGSGSIGSTSLIRDSRGYQDKFTDQQVYQQNLAGVHPTETKKYIFGESTGHTTATRAQRIQAEGILSGTGEGMARTMFREAFKNPFGGGFREAAEIASGLRKKQEADVLIDINSDAIANADAERNRKKQLAWGFLAMKDSGLMRFFQ